MTAQEFDLRKYYADTIGYYDTYRSNITILKETLSIDDIFRAEKKDESAEFDPRNPTVDFIESRAHVFYRMMGFPIVSDTGFYSPGDDTEVKEDENKIKIANEFLKTKSKQTLEYRDQYIKKYLKLFSNGGIASSVVLLSSIQTNSYFKDLIKDSSLDPLQIEPTNLEYTIDDKHSRGHNYLDYKDTNDKGPAEEINSLIGLPLSKRRKLLLPLTLDPRICFSVTGKKNHTVPFFVNEGPEAQKEIKYLAPGLQGLIVSKFSKKEEFKFSDDDIKFIANISLYIESSVKSDPELSNITDFFNKNKFNKEFFDFNQKISFMLKILKSCVKKSQEELNKYNMLPIGNPESEIAFRKINLLDQFNTTKDKELFTQKQLKDKDSIRADFQRILSSGEVQQQINTPDRCSIRPSTYLSTDPKRESESLFDTLYRELGASRSVLSSSLKAIESITGQFSGFGLIDSTVAYFALLLVEDDVIVSLIDERAYARAKAQPFNLVNLPPQIPIKEALKKLTEMMKNLYLVVHSLYPKVSE